MSKITLFLDSNIFIEFFKENEKAIEIFSFILENSDKLKVFINGIVWSEVVYQLCIKRDLDKKEIFEILDSFTKLPINSEVVEVAKFGIDKGLYPNYSLNFACVKVYEIDYLVSLDNDFKDVEDLIDDIDKLKGVL